MHPRDFLLENLSSLGYSIGRIAHTVVEKIFLSWNYSIRHLSFCQPSLAKLPSSSAFSTNSDDFFGASAHEA